LHALDTRLREELAHGLPDEVRVVYVSPLKADIHRDLAEPRGEIRRPLRGGNVGEQFALSEAVPPSAWCGVPGCRTRKAKVCWSSLPPTASTSPAA